MRNIYRLFRRIDQDYKHFTLKVCLTSIVLGLLPIINIIAPKLIIDELSGDISLGILGLIVGVILLANTINSILKTYYNNYFELVFESMTDKMLFDLSEKSLRLPIEESDSKVVQDKLEAAHDAVFTLFGLSEVMNFAVTSIITGIFAIGVLIRLSIFIPLIGLVVIIANKKFVNLIKENEITYQKKHIPDIRVYRYFTDFSQDFKYSKDLKIYKGEDLILEKSKFYMDRMTERSIRYFNKNGIYQGLMNITSNATIVAQLIYLTYRLIKKTISLADFTLYFNSIIQLINTINLCQKNYAQVISANEKLNSYFEFINLKEQYDPGKDYVNIDDDKISIEFRNVTFKYPKSDKNTLKNCSFKIDNGESVALVGKNGAGKSTIVKLLCKFYEPSEGAILINGVDLRDISKEDYYKILSPTFQDFRLFPFRVNENITADKAENISEDKKEEIYKSLKLLGIYDWVTSLPKGDNTYLTNLFDEEGIEPSGGIGQKIALSRSMIHGGKFFIMDEPTSALDPRSEQDIFEKMLEISKGQTSLFISHRLSSTKYADRIIVCDDGFIKENGSHDDLMKEDGLYKKMFTTQAELYS